MKLRLITFLCFISILWQAMIPAGFMPSFGKDGAIIEICTSQGIETVSLDDENSSNKDNANAHNKCLYTPHLWVANITEEVLKIFVLVPSQREIAYEQVSTTFVKAAHLSRAPPYVL